MFFVELTDVFVRFQNFGPKFSITTELPSQRINQDLDGMFFMVTDK